MLSTWWSLVAVAAVAVTAREREREVTVLMFLVKTLAGVILPSLL
jgi:hypothetical protein